MGYGSQKAPRRLSLAPGIPCWAGTGGTGLALGDSGPGPVVGVPTQAGPPGQWEAPTPPPSPRATSQHWLGGQKPGADPGGPSCLLGGGAQHWPPQQLGTEGEARAGKFTGSELAGHPQTAPAWGPQPFPGSKGGAEAATHGPQAMLTWQTSPSHRAHAEGSGVSLVFGAGTQQAMGTAVPQTCDHGALSPWQPPSPPASPSITHSVGQWAPGGGAPQQPWGSKSLNQHSPPKLCNHVQQRQGDRL